MTKPTPKSKKAKVQPSQMVKSLVSGKEMGDPLAEMAGVSSGFEFTSLNQSRVVLTGKPGSGKSTLLNSSPTAFIIDLEKGCRTTSCPRSLRWTCPEGGTYRDRRDAILDVCEKVIAARLAGATKVDHVGIDSYDKLVEILGGALCEEQSEIDVGDCNGGYGKGYAEVRRQVLHLVDNLNNSGGLGVVMCAHTTCTALRSSQGTTLKTTFAVSDSLKEPLYRYFDHILLITHGEVETDEDDPIMVKGKKIASRKLKVPARILRISPGSLAPGETSDEVKVRVPLKDKLVIPEMDGWAFLTTEYNDALERREFAFEAHNTEGD